MRGSKSFEFQACIAAVACLVIGLVVQACGKPAPAFRAQGAAAADADPAPAGEGGTGGGMTEPVSTPPPSTGGAPGKADAGRSGTGGAGTGGAGTGGALSADAAPPTGGVSGTGGAPIISEDAAAPGTGGMGTGGQVATGGASGTPGPPPDASRPDLRPPPVSSGPAACDPDPQAIRICKQLEPACQNCPDRNVWDECFRVSARGDDAACARYAIDNRCRVDQGGNWCGSLDCDAFGCPRANCRTVQGNGASAPCQAMLDQCPCN